MSFNPDEQRDRMASEHPLSNKPINFEEEHRVPVGSDYDLDKTICKLQWTPNSTMKILKDIINNGVFNGRSFESICCELMALHERKNKDYGGAFYNTMRKFGIAALLIRLDDKLSRLISVTKNGNNEVTDESIEDTLKDLASYAIMGLEYLYNTPQP